jgi:hypothetical protein
MDMEYPFMDGRGWPGSMPEATQFDRTTPPHAITNGMAPTAGWEDFLQWTPGQQQDAMSGTPTTAPPSRFANAQTIYTRRLGARDSQAPLELAGGGVPTSNPGSSNTPFTFGQNMSVSAPFDFTSPGSMISPMDQHGLPFNPHNGVSSRSPAEQVLMNSPYSHDGHPPKGAMPPHTAIVNLHESPSPNHARIGTSESQPSSPDDQPPHVNLKKRKSDDSDEIRSSVKGAPIKKTAHNMIEKRYRTNLNDKIAALRDSVPSLRVMSRNGGAEEDDDDVDLEGLAPAHKLNKATVLSKATEYIRHLEKRNKKLQDDLDALKKQMNSYEKMTMNSFAFPGGVGTPDGMPRYDQNPFDNVSPQPGNQNPVQGMIRIPEDIRNMRQNTVMQPAYATPAQYPNYNAPPTGRPMINGRGSNFVNKMMVGSLAALMLFEGFSEPEKSGEEPEGRGLFALPVSLLSDIGGYLWPRSLLLGASPYEALALAKVCLIVGALVYVLLPLFDFKPKRKKPALISLSPVPAIASPIETRRKAWLTAIQTVWVPQHQFFLEATALLLKTLKLSTRKLIGWQGYAFVWNVTKEQEAARIKAWDIALDAQLTGGDAEISMSRLILTLLASGTLPDTPSRLMLKALHIRVLLWEVANAGYGTWYMFDELSMKLARRYWNQARLEHKMNMNNPNKRDEQEAAQELPEHLQALLELPCDQVLVKSIIQRAYNLAWNRPSFENTQPDQSTDSVVADFAISSPLDALAAWFSSLVINRVLEHSLVQGSSKAVLSSLHTAIAIAPPNSAVQVRAITAQAVLIKKRRLQLIEAAYKALPKPSRTRSASDSNLLSNQQPLNVVPTTPVTKDVPVALVLAKCLALVEDEDNESDEVAKEAREGAVAALLQYRPTENGFSILSFAAAYRVLDHFTNNPELKQEAQPILERMANAMRVWIGKDGTNHTVAAMNQKIRMKVVERCLAALKLLTGVRYQESDIDDEESDAGYGSLEEEGEKKT